MDRGTWRATVHGVVKVGHDLVTAPPRTITLSILLGLYYTHTHTHTHTHIMYTHAYISHIHVYMWYVYIYKTHNGNVFYSDILAVFFPTVDVQLGFHLLMAVFCN